MKQSKQILNSIFSVSSILIIIKIFGFIKQMVTASVFGATIETDLINLSQEFIANIEYVLANTIATSFVSVYILTKSNNKDEGDKLFSDAIKLITSFIVIFVIVLCICAPIISKILAPFYEEELSRQLTMYLRIYAPVLFFYILTSLFGGVLNANERFVIPQLSGLFQSIIVIIVSICIGRIIGVKALIISFWIYIIWNCLFQGIISKKYWKIYTSNPLKNKNIKMLIKMMIPLLIGYSMIFINQQVDKIIVSGMEDGTVTAMTYGAVLSNFVTTMTGAACTVLFTHLTKNISIGNLDNTTTMVIESAKAIITLLLPVSIIAIMCSNDIAAIAFGRGAFDEEAVSRTAVALIGYSFCFVPFGLKDLFSRFQYGQQDTKTPMINTTISILANIVLSIILSRFWGVFGVTFASSIAEIIAACLNMSVVHKKNPQVRFLELLKECPTWLIGGFVCSVICYVGNIALADSNSFIRLIVICFASFIAYAIINARKLLKIREYI